MIFLWGLPGKWVAEEEAGAQNVIPLLQNK